jgi:hypothetical protein
MYYWERKGGDSTEQAKQSLNSSCGERYWRYISHMCCGMVIDRCAPFVVARALGAVLVVYHLSVWGSRDQLDCYSRSDLPETEFTRTETAKS